MRTTLQTRFNSTLPIEITARVIPRLCSRYGLSTVYRNSAIPKSTTQRYNADETAYNTNINRQGDFLDSLKVAFVNYAEGVRDLPPSDEPLGADGWRALMVDPGLAGWRGPYLPATTEVPMKDGWQNPITYRRKISRVGNVFGELISNGPNGRFSEGMTDDIRVLIVIRDDLQAELQARRNP